MRKSLLRMKGAGFIIWHSRHEFYHILLGLIWAWFLREQWNEFSYKWIWLAVFASVLPDIDHINYFLTYGKRESYSQQVKRLLREKQWRNLTVFLETGHKYNVSLSSHNYYFMAILLGLSFLSSLYDWKVGVIMFGAMLTHYLFDVFDDLTQLGEINPNWKRWGRNK
jgi:hypothetical protein